jgi:hypothetical protein
MGGSNMAHLIANVYPHLGNHHRTRAALAIMATIAQDNPTEEQPAREYFGGPGHIAEALGLCGTPKSNREAVSRALRPAHDLGVVEPFTRRTRAGRDRPAYRLHLGPIANEPRDSLWTTELALERVAPDTQRPVAPDTQRPVASDTQRPVAPNTQPEERREETEEEQIEEPTSPGFGPPDRAREAGPFAEQSRLNDDGTLGHEPYSQVATTASTPRPAQ